MDDLDDCESSSPLPRLLDSVPRPLSAQAPDDDSLMEGVPPAASATVAASLVPYAPPADSERALDALDRTADRVARFYCADVEGLPRALSESAAARAAELAGEQSSVARVEEVLAREERATWRLVEAVQEHRGAKGAERKVCASADTRYEGDALSDALCSDTALRELRAVVEWLEWEAEGDAYADAGEPADWTASLDCPRQTSLDPDAPLDALHEDDAKRDEELCKSIWSLVRCGQIERAQALCRDCRQPWRAALLSGCRMHASDGTGNPRRRAWRRAVRAACEAARNKWERATYGVLSGLWGHAVPVCASWRDWAWVLLRVMYDAEADRAVSHLGAAPDGDCDYAGCRTDAAASGADGCDELMSSVAWASYGEAFRVVESSASHAVLADPHARAYHRLQEMLIAKPEGELLDSLRRWALSEPPRTVRSSYALRVATHIALVLLHDKFDAEDAAARDDVPESVLQLIEDYVAHLVDAGKNDVVARYASFLPAPRATAVYVKFLSRQRDRDERYRLLALAEAAGLPSQPIAKAAAEESEAVADEESRACAPKDAAVANPLCDPAVAEAKIRSVEWLCFDKSMIVDALLQANRTTREFIKAGNLQAAAKLVGTEQWRGQLQTLPKEFLFPESLTYTEDPSYKSVLTERLSLQAYVLAHLSYDEWAANNALPLPRPSMQHRGTDAASRLVWRREKDTYDVVAQQWKARDEDLAHAAETSLRNALCFAQGFLSLPSSDDHESITELRMVCVPRMVKMLQNIYSKTGNTVECSALPFLVAEEPRNLHDAFDKEALRSFISAHCEFRISQL
eukprot:m51a1_g3571 putative nuclear pore complex protein nup107 (805) ;mRNA; f:1097170-1100479